MTTSYDVTTTVRCVYMYAQFDYKKIDFYIFILLTQKTPRKVKYIIVHCLSINQNI